MSKVVFRVDGSKTLGLGHISRCLTLANYLKTRKIKSIFVIINKSIKDKIENQGHDVIILQSKSNEFIQLQKILKDVNYKYLIIDSKRKLCKDLEKLKKYTKIILIDNKTNLKIDLAIFPGPKKNNFVEKKSNITGIEYIIINSNFKKRVLNLNKSILISAGASDKYNITKKLVSSFKKKKNKFHVIVILGKFYQCTQEIKKIIGNDERFELVVNVDNIAKIMNRCSIGIVTFGITVYEAARVGLPIFIISHSNENSISSKEIDKIGCGEFIGKYNRLNYKNVTDNILEKNKDKNYIVNMHKAGKQIDGKGVKRVADAIFNLK